MHASPGVCLVSVNEWCATLPCGQGGVWCVYEELVLFIYSVQPGCKFLWLSGLYTVHRAANPPDFRGSLPILRSILRLYDLTMQTPDFSHVSPTSGDAILFRRGPLSTVCLRKPRSSLAVAPLPSLLLPHALTSEV